jgi:hypothetical protein
MDQDRWEEQFLNVKIKANTTLLSGLVGEMPFGQPYGPHYKTECPNFCIQVALHSHSFCVLRFSQMQVESVVGPMMVASLLNMCRHFFLIVIS